ncbi:MAG TPA: PIG-L deacetylase family protein [Actinomycetota bacterium]|nr:PIG-L deacetylase family protein [Actinomycetota bacterium]
MRFDDTLDISRAMVIYAHPDDAEFGASGTVAKWVRAGVEVTYVMITNGGSGSSDPAMTREKLVEIRRAEQEAAAKVLGVAHVEFLGFEDGYLVVNEESRRAVARQVRRYKPDVIIGLDPTLRYTDFYTNHPDHIAAGDLVMFSINPDASTRLMFPELVEQEGLEPHKPKMLLLMNWGAEPDHVEDISSTIDVKIEALSLHASQVENMDEIEQWVRQRAGEIGAPTGYAAGEGFKVVRFE